ncbi:rifin, partial [Plasmodium reichenowi]
VINIWKNVALDVGIKEAIAAGTADIAAAGVKAGIEAGNNAVIAGIKSTYSVDELGGTLLKSFFTSTPYKNVTNITQAVYEQYFEKCTYDPLTKVRFLYGGGNRHIPICRSVWQQTQAVSKTKKGISEMEGIRTAVETMVSDAEGYAKVAAEAARESAINTVKAREAGVINTIFMSKQTAIIASVVAILIIVLIMVIIYLILRYRRKKKMKKKAQYTKLLNE